MWNTQLCHQAQVIVLFLPARMQAIKYISRLDQLRI